MKTLMHQRVTPKSPKYSWIDTRYKTGKMLAESANGNNHAGPILILIFKEFIQTYH